MLCSLLAAVVLAPHSGSIDQYADVRATLDKAYAVMPDALRKLAQASENSLPALNIYSATPGGNAYVAFAEGRDTIYNHLYLEPGTGPDMLSHEVGHYITHILMGSPKFRLVSDSAPDEAHGLGDPIKGRPSITEDYAYFNQYVVTGRVDAGSPATGRWISVISHKQPNEVDYPSIEGFGCALMAALCEAPTFDFTGKKGPPFGEPIQFGLTAGDVYNLYPYGATNINKLVEVIRLMYVGEPVRARKLQALAEQIGWSYHASPKIVDTSGRPVVGAQVTSMLLEGDKIEHRLQTVVSDAKGIAEVKRIYPGGGTLRIVSFYDRLNPQIQANGSLPTNEPLKLDEKALVVPAYPRELKGRLNLTTTYGDISVPYRFWCDEGVFVDGDDFVFNAYGSYGYLQFDERLTIQPRAGAKEKFVPERLVVERTKLIGTASPYKREKVKEDLGQMDRIDLPSKDFGPPAQGGVAHISLKGQVIGADGSSQPRELPIMSISRKETVASMRGK